MPQILAWSKSLSVGNDLIDEQHKMLIVLFNKIFNLADTPASEVTEAFHILLNDLVALANTHFDSEEKILEMDNSPTLVEHRAEHERYREKLTEILFKATKGVVDSDNLRLLVGEWQDLHIPKFDIANKSFVKKI